MPTERKVQRFRGNIEEIEYRLQSSIAFDEFKKETAYGISRKGAKCWTTFKIYFTRPSINHPMTIHWLQYNPNGNCMAQMTLEEFDQLIDDIYKWREKYAEDINQLSEANFRLQRNKSHLDKITSLLSKYDFSEPPQITVDGVNITEKSTQREKELIMASIQSLKTSQNRAWLLQDILSRLDDLTMQNIDISDIYEFLKSKTTLLERTRN